MKKLLMFLLVSFFAIYLYAQKDVTTFLGIPVDGYKSEMRQKLIAKGFVPRKSGTTEYFEGEFNGTDVHIYIGTNNNKVYRIMVCDANTQDEANIKIRFNRLVSQFENNKRYLSLAKFTIPDSEDISYEMLVHKKTYDASFCQFADLNKVDTLAMSNKIREQLSEKYTPEQFENSSDEVYQESLSLTNRALLDLTLKKSVWFRISESYGEYFITMYYDNEYNHANGEDL